MRFLLSGSILCNLGLSLCIGDSEWTSLNLYASICVGTSLYLCSDIAMYLCGWLWLAVTLAGPGVPWEVGIKPDYHLTTTCESNQNLCPSSS